jgi:hypothetical protein
MLRLKKVFDCLEITVGGKGASAYRASLPSRPFLAGSEVQLISNRHLHFHQQQSSLSTDEESCESYGVEIIVRAWFLFHDGGMPISLDGWC